jgi:hypothetical protein
VPVALATTHAPRSISATFLDWRFKPQLDQPQHMPVHNATSHRLDEIVVWNCIEGSGDTLPISAIIRIM